MKKAVLFLGIILLSLSVRADKIVINLDIKVTNKGDAKVVYSMKATAMQWKQLMAIYGNNPALLKRQIIDSLPTYELTNFNFKKDEMNRSFIFSFDAKGVVKYLGNGKWQFEYDKKATAKKINETQWFFTDTENDGNVLLETDTTLTLPKGAKDVKTTVNEFGKNVLEYTLKPPTHINWLLIIGILLFLAGIITVVIAFTAIKE